MKIFWTLSLFVTHKSLLKRFYSPHIRWPRRCKAEEAPRNPLEDYDDDDDAGEDGDDADVAGEDGENYADDDDDADVDAADDNDASAVASPTPYK